MVIDLHNPSWMLLMKMMIMMMMIMMMIIMMMMMMNKMMEIEITITWPIFKLGGPDFAW